MGQETGQRASPGQNITGSRIHNEHNETQMKVMTGRTKMAQGEQDAKARWDMVKRLEADKAAGFGGDGKNESMKLERYGRNVDSVKMKMDYEKMMREQTNVQVYWKKPKHL